MARLVSYNEVISPAPIKVGSMRLAIARVDYETVKGRYAHFDCRRAIDCAKLFSNRGVITGKLRKLDGAILVVSAKVGPMRDTRRQIQLAKKYGIKSIVAYISQIDLVTDPELIELVELETRELLEQYGFKDAPIIRGSALMALNDKQPSLGEDSIIKLLSAMDASFIK